MGGGLAVADVIEAIFELLPGDGGAVGPEVFAGDHLAEGVVLVNPVGAVGVGRPRSLFGDVHSFHDFKAFVSMVRNVSYIYQSEHRFLMTCIGVCAGGFPD